MKETMDLSTTLAKVTSLSIDGEEFFDQLLRENQGEAKAKRKR
jgi:hypothetical protein